MISQSASILDQCKIDPVAILDVNVGGAAVFPVADLLRTRGVPVIFATGYGTSGLPARFENDPKLPKPFSYEELAKALRTVLTDQPCHSEAA